MGRGKKWTKEEDEILVQALKANSLKVDACLQASKQLGRTTQACLRRTQTLRPAEGPNIQKRIVKRWTEEEDKFFLKAIKNGSYNLQAVFEFVAEELGRTTDSVTSRWYRHLSNPKDSQYAGICFISIAENLKLKNRKIWINGYKVEPEKPTLWRRIKKFLHM